MSNTKKIVGVVVIVVAIIIVVVWYWHPFNNAGTSGVTESSTASS